MRTLIIVTLAATGLALPALAATGISPDPSVWVMLGLGAMMLALTTKPLTAGHLRRKSGHEPGRVAQ